MSKPPPGLERIIELLAEKEGEASYLKRGLPEPREIRALFRLADRKEYSERGPDDDALRFFRNTGIVFTVGQYDYFDPERAAVVLAACEDGREPEADASPEEKQRKLLDKLAARQKPESKGSKQERSTTPATPSPSATPPASILPRSPITEITMSTPSVESKPEGTPLSSATKTGEKEPFVYNTDEKVYKGLPIRIAYMTKEEVDTWAWLSSSTHIVDLPKDGVHDRIILPINPDTLAGMINQPGLENVVTSDGVRSFVQRLASAGVLELIETERIPGHTAYKIAIPFGAIAVRQVDQRVPRLISLPYWQLIMRLQREMPVIPLHQADSGHGGELVKAEALKVLKQLGTSNALPTSIYINLCCYRVLPKRAKDGWGIIVAEPKLNPVQGLIALPYFEAIEFRIDGTGTARPEPELEEDQEQEGTGSPEQSGTEESTKPSSTPEAEGTTPKVDEAPLEEPTNLEDTVPPIEPEVTNPEPQPTHEELSMSATTTPPSLFPEKLRTMTGAELADHKAKLIGEREVNAGRRKEIEEELYKIDTREGEIGAELTAIEQDEGRRAREKEVLAAEAQRVSQELASIMADLKAKQREAQKLQTRYEEL